MWEYRATDYTDDDIQHWKYIKRYKTSSGKWRYVYADKSTHNQINSIGARAQQLTNRQSWQRDAVGGSDSSRDAITTTGAMWRSYNQKRLATTNKSLSSANQLRDKLITSNTPASKIKQSASNLYSKGKSLVEKLFKKK